MDPPSAACRWGRSVPLRRMLPAVVLVVQTPARPDLVLHGRRHPRSALPPPWKKPGARRLLPAGGEDRCRQLTVVRGRTPLPRSGRRSPPRAAAPPSTKEKGMGFWGSHGCPSSPATAAP
ncbi:hypothetical protein ACLOJK_036209 [Asimina triloba]